MELFADDFFEETLLEYKDIQSLIDKAVFAHYMKEDGEEESKGFIANSIEKVKSLIQKILNMITNAVGRLKNKISYMCLSPEQKQKYDNFMKFVEQHPEVKNKQVTVKDWKRIEREYAKVEKNILNMITDENIDANGLTLKTKDMINNLGKTASTATAALTVDTAINMAKQSPEAARLIQNTMMQNQDILNTISRELGNKEVAKMQKKVNQMTKETVGRKLLVQLGLQKEKTLTECMNNVVDSFSSLGNVGMAVAKSNTKDTIKHGAKALSQHGTFARNMGTAYMKDARIKRGINQAINFRNDVNNTINNTSNKVQNALDDPLAFVANRLAGGK